MAALGIPLLKLGDPPVAAPALAYGTGTAWFNKKEEHAENEALVSSVACAVKLGFRHIDCAEMYGNERHVGLGLQRAGVPREELFLTSKVHASLADPEAGIRATLSRLQVPSLDLYLVHSPFKFASPAELQQAWARLEACVHKGYTRALGVSNFSRQDLEQLLRTAHIPPAVNQIEFHPYLQSPELVSFCADHKIVVEAYGGLAPILGAAGGPLDPILDDVAARQNRTKAQVLLRWGLQKGCMMVTTTSKPERMQEYLAVGSFDLSEADMLAIDAAGQREAYRRFWADNFAEPAKL